MKQQIFVAMILTALVGCGEDTGSRRGSPTFETPTVTGDEFITASFLHRGRGLNVLTSKTEISLINNQALPAGYRIIPLMNLDDEGTNNKNIRTRSGMGRPAVDCGMISGLSISARITECASLNSNSSTWIGAAEGASGESTWSLVARSGPLEVWQDIRTGHLWSDIVDTTNWCNASGNNLQETDASVNCQTLALNLTCIGKTIMGLSGVTWRLPTRNDYLQGDLDGLRFVLKESDATGFWTATMNSTALGRTEAWVYQQKQGTLQSAPLGNNRQVRCIGAALL